MGGILVHEFATLDGVIDEPTWARDFGFDPAMGAAIGELTSRADAILLGRKTYEMFAPVWSKRTADEDPGAPFFNETPKHVVSATLEEATWQNTIILGPYDASAIQQLKDSVAGGVYVSGSGTLVRAMLADGLVEELHLFVYPLLTGGGRHLYEGPAPVDLRLERYEQYENGVLYLVYEAAIEG